MKFYHGTTEANWKKIQLEGVLWGIRNAPSRCTCLAVKPHQAMKYGPVVLEVEYEPDNDRKDEIGSVHNFWNKNCWSIRVYEPIPVDKVKRYYNE